MADLLSITKSSVIIVLAAVFLLKAKDLAEISLLPGIDMLE